MHSAITDLLKPNSSAPVIGISGASSDSSSVKAMMARVREAGAKPLLLANHARRTAAKDLPKMDAAVIMGNNFDNDPHDYISRYPEGDPRRAVHPKTKSVSMTQASMDRNAYEKQLIKLVLDAQMPLFCICGGMQLVNIMLGGTLHQHIPDLLGHDDLAKNAGQAMSSPVVPVSIVPNTLLARIGAEQSLYAPNFPPLMPSAGTVNAFHHQAVDWVGKGLIACAYSSDYTSADGKQERLVEAIEADPNGPYKDQFFLGVQWHPEFLPDNATSERVLNSVNAAASKYAKENNREHDGQELLRENVLSALPMLQALSSQSKSFAESLKPGSTPGDRTPGKGKSR